MYIFIEKNILWMTFNISISRTEELGWEPRKYLMSNISKMYKVSSLSLIFQ